MSSLRAVLFDLDGVLVDSEPTWFRVEQRVMATLAGPPWRPEDQAACVGGTLPRTADYMLTRAGSPVANEEVQRRLLTNMVGEVRAGVRLKPGADALLRALGAAEVPCALVSSSYRDLVDAALTGLGRERFAVSVAGDEVRRPKPHPEPYLRAAAALGVDPQACVAFEDAPAGVTSAEAAGCVCVAVPDVAPVVATPNRPVIDTLAGVTLAWLEELVTNRTTGAREGS